MNATLLVILCQTTCVLSIGLLAIHWLRNQHVQLAANIGNLTSISAAVLVIACFVELPRPLSIQLGKQATSPVPQAESLQDVLQQSDITNSGSEANGEPFSATLISLGIGSHYKTQVESCWWIGDYFSDSSEWSIVIAVLGIVLFVLFLLRLFLGIYTAIRLTTEAVDLPKWQWPIAVRTFYDTHSDKVANVQLKVHAAIHSPCVHALSCNTIFVPPGFLEWSEEEAVSAFAHEFAHLRRRDSLWRFLAELGLSVVALHPLSHWMRCKAIMAQELATDLMATELLGNSRLYQIGLSRLLLRLDRQSNGLDWRLGYGVGVSVFSSSLIRRIEMLGQGQKLYVGSRSKLNWVFLATACVAIALCGSWGVEADEPTRLAAKPVTSSKKVESRLFAKENKETEAILAGQTGYLHLDLRAGKEHPAMRMALDFVQQVCDQTILLPVEGQRPKAIDLGLDVNEIETVEAGVQVQIAAAARKATDSKEGSAAEPKDDSKFQLTLGSNAFRIKTKGIVDWPKLIAGLDPAPFGPMGKDFVGLAQTLQPTNLLSIGFKESANDNTTSTNEVTTSKPELAAIWNACDGGFMTAAALIPADNPMSQIMDDPVKFQELSEEQKQIATAVEALSAVALGVDFEPGQPALTFRIVLQASAGVTQSQLLEIAGKARKGLVTEMEEGGGGRMLIKAISNAPLEALAGEDGESLVAIQFAYDPILAMVLGN